MSTKQYNKYLEDEYNKQVGDDDNIPVPKFKTVGVKYQRSTQIYTFMTEFDCEVGDKAVILTGGNWNVVTIVEIHDKPKLDGNYIYTWLVDIVDRTEYDACVTKEHMGDPQAGSRL